MENNNIRTMKFICVDDWGRDVYKCIETGVLYKDLADRICDEDLTPELYSCGNEITGEPCGPIKKALKLSFIKPVRPTHAERFRYQLLSRLKSDCNYYLGNGGRNAKQLWAEDEEKQIQKMKELYNSFPDGKKPEWLTYEQILKYEKMLKNK